MCSTPREQEGKKTCFVFFSVKKWPAAAVIPAPVAYIKFVAVKKLVVEALWGGRAGSSGLPSSHPPEQRQGH